MSRALAGLVVLLSVISQCWAQNTQNCVITGGENFGTIYQNCNLSPPLFQFLMKDFAVKEGTNGTFDHLITVRFNYPVTMILAACGEGVVDVDASVLNGMMAVPTPRPNPKPDCVAKDVSATPGDWFFKVQTKTRDAKFTLQPIVVR